MAGTPRLTRPRERPEAGYPGDARDAATRLPAACPLPFGDIVERLQGSWHQPEFLEEVAILDGIEGAAILRVICNVI